MRLPLALAAVLLVHAARGAEEEEEEPAAEGGKRKIQPMTDEERAQIEAAAEAEVTEWDGLLNDAHMALMEQDTGKMLRSFSKVPDGANNKRYVAMHGMPPLWFAIHNRQVTMVKWLLEKGGANLDYKEKDVTFKDDDGKEHFFKGNTAFDLVKEPDPKDENAVVHVDNKDIRRNVRDLLNAYKKGKDEL
eukprot:COSAG01_NODE_12_length_41732_cov_160.472964_16_plen_190_part_00